VAWAGPVGWIAAALMLIGALVMAFGAKNDLQLFAQHCFLGENFGEGGSDATGKAWMGTLGWTGLKSHRQARLALLRMLTGFTTYVGPPTYAGFIFPSYVPSGAFFEVEVDIIPKGEDSPKDTYRAVIWPTDGAGDYSWKGKRPDGDCDIKIERSGGQVTTIDVRARPKNNPTIDYNLRVRLVYDASGKNALPATVKWVKNSTVGMYIYNEKSSNEAEAEGE
jgi:hypothetical protein